MIYENRNPDKKSPEGMWLQSVSQKGGAKLTRSGILWTNLNKRLISHKEKDLSYNSCKNLFDNFQLFSEWCNNEVNYRSIDNRNRFYNLDKDILIPENKVYSSDTCCFIPQDLNLALSKGNSRSNKGLIGTSAVIYKSGVKYISQISSPYHKRNYLGTFDSEMEAHRSWQIEKIKVLKMLIEDYSYLPDKIVNGLNLHILFLKSNLSNNEPTNW